MRNAVLPASLALAVGVSAAFVHPMAAVALVLGIGVLSWILSSALNATLAFIVVLFLRPSDIVPALAVLQPAKLLALVAIFLWFSSRLLRGNLKLSSAPHGKWILALVFAVLASTVVSSDRASSMTMLTDTFVKVMIMYALAVQLVDTKKSAFRLHLTLGLSTVALALFALYQRSAGLATIEGNRAAFVGLLADPNDLALVLLMYVPLFTELALGQRGVRRLPSLLLGLILVTGVLVTVSRGGALGLMTALGLTLYDRGSLRLRLFLLPAVAALVLGMVVVAGVNDRSSGAINQGELDESSQARLDSWGAGLRMTMHHPVLGVGFGQFPNNYQTYVLDTVKWGPTDAHNSYIKVVAETGMLGFIPFMALLFLCFRSAYRLRKLEVSEDRPRDRAVRRALFPSLAGFCVAAFFLSQCWSWFLFILFAQSAALHEIWKPEIESSARTVSTQDVRERNKLGLEACRNGQS